MILEFVLLFRVLGLCSRGMEGAIRAAILDEAIVFKSVHENAGARLHAGADKLLIRLRYSGLILGLLCRSELSANKISLLEGLGVFKDVLLVFLDKLGTDKRMELIFEQWGVSAESCLCVCAETNLDEYRKLDSSWKIQTVREGDVGYVPFFISSLNKKTLRNHFVVGHCMKWRREKDLLQRGAMPLDPVKSGLSFVPIDLSSPLETQLCLVDVVLNKATDEIVSVSKTAEDSNFGGIKFSESFNKLEHYLLAHPEIRVVDPTDRVIPLMDRVATQKLLHELPLVQTTGSGLVRPPHWLKVSSFDELGLSAKLNSANVHLPTIVKPQIACGASESHTMAVVFDEQGYVNLPVPVPAIIQEYIDHQSIIYKFYVLGQEVFVSTRKSTPDASVLRSILGTNKPAIVFDSLKSLPTGSSTNTGGAPTLDFTAMRSIATLLGQQLGLTIIGFDVVVQTGTGDHVIVDVNYFPTFKDVPDAEAVPAFWKALKEPTSSS